MLLTMGNAERQSLCSDRSQGLAKWWLVEGDRTGTSLEVKCIEITENAQTFLLKVFGWKLSGQP